MKKYFLSILIFAFVIVSNMVVFGAADDEYLQNEVWINNPDVCSESINKRSTTNQLDGVFKYYFDAHNNVIYTSFSVSESTITNQRSDIRIMYTVSSVFEAYHFSVSQSGICDAADSVSNCFNSKQSFVTYDNTNSGLYISAVEINNGCNKNNISVRLYVNGHSYKIIDNISVEKVNERNAIASSKAEMTLDEAVGSDGTVTKTSKVRKESTTKKQRSSAKSRVSTSKFKYNPSKTYKATEKVTQNESVATTVQEVTEQYSEEPQQTEYSKTTKIYCTVGIGFAIVGVMLLLASLVRKNNHENEQESGTQE